LTGLTTNVPSAFALLTVPGPPPTFRRLRTRSRPCRLLTEVQRRQTWSRHRSAYRSSR
jgi:hypothetical protein